MTTTTTERHRQPRSGAAPAPRPKRAAAGRLGTLPARPVPADLPDRLHPGDDGLRPHALDRRPDHRGARRPAPRRPARRSASTRPATTGRSSCSTSSTSGRSSRGDFGTTITDNRPVTEVLLDLRRARRSSSRSTRCSSRSSSASRSACSPPACRDRCAGRRRCASSRSSATRRPVFFAGLLLKLVFSVWLGWLPGRRPGVHRHRDPALRRCDNRTGIYLIDAIRSGDPERDRATCSSTPSCPAIALGLLTAGIFLRLVRTNVIGTLGMAVRRRGPVPRRQRAAGCVRKHAYQPGADPDHHRDRPADRAAARRRGAHRDDLRVEGPRLPARPSTSRPATSSPCRASSSCSRSSSRSPTSSSTSSPRSSTRG